jgi:hypothetical protein
VTETTTKRTGPHPVSFDDCVWVVLDLNQGSKIVQAFEAVQPALRLAGSIVGNMSYAGPMGDIYLFGRGDGNTEVMVRQLPRGTCLNEDVIITPKR